MDNIIQKCPKCGQAGTSSSEVTPTRGVEFRIVCEACEYPGPAAYLALKSVEKWNALPRPVTNPCPVCKSPSRIKSAVDGILRGSRVSCTKCLQCGPVRASVSEAAAAWDAIPQPKPPKSSPSIAGCPDCQSPAQIEKANGGRANRAGCTQCGRRGPLEPTELAAATAWNRLKPTPKSKNGVCAPGCSCFVCAQPPLAPPEWSPPKPARNKYQREIKPGVWVDVYDVLAAFEVTCPAMAHALKKCLAPGQRGVKDSTQDKREAIASIERSIEMEPVAQPPRLPPVPHCSCCGSPERSSQTYGGNTVVTCGGCGAVLATAWAPPVGGA